jgi:hypothetical protein
MAQREGPSAGAADAAGLSLDAAVVSQVRGNAQNLPMEWLQPTLQLNAT